MLLHPASKGYSMVTEYLLENGANPKLADKLGVTPLVAATRKGQRDVVAVLLQHKADVNAVSLEVRAIARCKDKNNIVLGIRVCRVCLVQKYNRKYASRYPL